MKNRVRLSKLFALMLLAGGLAALDSFTDVSAHDGHKKGHAPATAKKLRNPVEHNAANIENGKALYEANCAVAGPHVRRTPGRTRFERQGKRSAGTAESRTALSKLFPESFPASGSKDADPFTVENVTKAIAAFERILISGDSPYDRYLNGDARAVSASVKRGEALFFGERLECFHCHGGFNFSQTTDHAGKAFIEIEFHNTGLYNLYGKGASPKENTGIFEFTNNPEDVGKFRAPSLRNIALTAPYMHDGSIATLEEVIDHYAAGGRTIRSGEFKGVGKNNPNKSSFVKGFRLTPQEKRDLLNYLKSLTDEKL